MLKFIRKYQLIILAVGGSLLMVVFLLQPILTRLSPSPLKAQVATLEDGKSFTRADIQRANVAISLLRRVNPRALMPRAAGGYGIDTSSEENTALHWLLLSEHARRAGLVGETGDGQAYIDMIADREAGIQVQSELQQGLIAGNTRAELLAAAERRMSELRPQIIEIINRNVSMAAGSAREDMDEVYRILAQARGIERLLGSVQTLPAYSDLGAVRAGHALLNAVAVNAAVIDSRVVAPTIADPGEQELQSFFERYADQRPGENDYGIGYMQPTRMRLGWLTLDMNALANAVEVDRVELNKIYLRDRETYEGDFASERFEIERQYRREQATDMMVEADRVLRAQVLARTGSLPRNNGLVVLPEDWEQRRPRLENMAEAVVEQLGERFDTSIPTPEVTIVGDRWLNANQISALPGFGSATYRVGSNQIPTFALPQFFGMTEPNTTGFDVQEGLPLAEPPATDETGNRYYAIIFDVREAGPAEIIDDVGREQVIQDYKSVQAYEMLVERLDEFRAAIESNGSLAPAIDLALALGDGSQAPRPGVLRNLLVRRDAVERGVLAARADPRLNTPAFRDAVLAAAADLDPLTAPEALDADPVPIAVGLPSARAIALALVVAPRPLTSDRFRLTARGVIQNAAQQELARAGLAETSPFSFESLSARYGLVKTGSGDDEVPAPVAEDELEPAEASLPPAHD